MSDFVSAFSIIFINVTLFVCRIFNYGVRLEVEWKSVYELKNSRQLVQL